MAQADAFSEKPSMELVSQEPLESANFPKGFWKQVDYLLHHPGETIESIKRGTDLGRISGILFIISIVMAAAYGMVMGATNLLQASTMPLHYKFLMIITTGIKVPVLFILTMIIVFPPIYVSNSYVGSRLSFLQMLSLMISTIAITSVSLASGATISFFFAITSRSYHFIKLLHVFVFVCSGLAGLTYLSKSLMRVTPLNMKAKAQTLFLGWLVIYAFVGLELAWVLRPFVGNPKEKFTLFREHKGNIYESVIKSIGEATREGK